MALDAADAELTPWYDLGFTQLVFIAACIYIVHYIREVVEVPRFIGGGEFYEFLKRRCDAVHRRYVPPVFFHNSYVQTVLRALLQTKPVVGYQREYIKAADGEKLTLDWVLPASAGDVARSTPMVLILPGMTGSDDSSYSRHLSKIIKELGYIAVVFTSRGNGDATVESPRLHHAAYTEDVESVVDYLQRKGDGQPILCIAISMGGCIMGNYLAKCQERRRNAGISAALFISTGWNVLHSITIELEKPLQKLIINKHLLRTAKRVLIKHHDVLNAHYPDYVPKALKAKSLMEFDNSITAPVFGFESAQDYYSKASLHEKIERFDVPVLCLLAADDPIFPEQGIPLDKVKKNPNVAILLTKRGGHIGHICQYFPASQENFINIVAKSFVNAVLSNYDEFVKCTRRQL